MQLNLLSRLGPRAAAPRTEPPSTVPGAWRDSAIMQLEAIAAANERAAVLARRRNAAALVSLVCVVLGVWAMLWRPLPDGNDTPRTLAVWAGPPAAATPAAVADAPRVVAVETTPQVAAVAPAAEPTAVPDAQPVVAATADDDAAARQARAARRKAALLAQERARTEEEALRQRVWQAQRDEESARAQQQRLADAAREQATAEQARRQALLLAQHRPRTVVELCAGSSGWASEQQCHARQCWKAEHQGDAVCVRLRELEFARLQRGADH